jgi:DNA repair exonuclease SbcCD nuclease subunit
VLQLGDLYDRRKYTNHVTLFESSKYFFSKFEEYGIQLITLLGNHDLYFKNSLEVSSSELFLPQYKNITVISKPTVMDICGEDITIIPWVCDENYQECVDLITNSNTNICVGHFEIESFKMYKGGISCEHGLKPDLFKKFEYVWSGHFHHKSTKGNISYLGTPYPMTWQDYGDQKGFHIFDLAKRKLSFIKNPLDIFIQIEYDDSNINDVLKSEYLTESYLSNMRKKYVKVKVVNKINPYHFDVFVDKLYASDPIDISIIDDQEIEMTDDVVDETADTLTIVNSYIDGITTDLDKSQIKQIMTQLYTAALSLE